MATPKKKKPFARKNCHGKKDTRPVIWTPEVVAETLTKALKLLKADKPEVKLTTELRGGKKSETIVRTGYKYYYLGQLSVELDFSFEYWDRWMDQYGPKAKTKDAPASEGIPEICQAIERVKSILHARAWESGLKGDTNAHMTKFHLINNFGAKEIVNTEHSGQVELQHSHKRMIQDAIRRSKGVK